MGKLSEFFERQFGGGANGTKRVRTFYWIVLIALLGAAVMVINGFLTVKEVDPTSASRASPSPQSGSQAASTSSKQSSIIDEIEHIYETRLKEILQNIVGVGDVDVLVTIESTEELSVDKNYKDSQQQTNERDNNGATRNITEVNRSGDVVLYQVSSGNQQPLVLKTIKPKVRGVVVVAKGAENLTLKKMITEAVERGLDVSAIRISVLPRKQ
jgi:stage III sporulation protein AG